MNCFAAGSYRYNRSQNENEYESPPCPVSLLQRCNYMTVAPWMRLWVCVASFPGPVQLFVACSTEQPKAARGPGNEARVCVCLVMK